jgi:tripartite-type tricarboxylate transporter receptor subunit TctC
MLADVALLLNAAIRPKSIAYDPQKDYTPVGLLGSAPFVLYVPASGSKNLADFLAKGNKKTITIANSGPGSLGHLAAELLHLKSRSAIVSVPYRGAGPAMNDTVGGQVDAIFGSTPSGMPLVNNGQLRALAVASPKRADDFPALPTFDELGIADVHVLNWWGIIAPAGTDQKIVDRLYGALQKVAALPGMRERFKTLGITPSMQPPAEFAQVMKADLALWSSVVKEAKIKVE